MRQKFEVEKFIEDKKIDETNISLAMTSNADLIGFYGYQESLWKSFVESIKLQYETLSSQLEINIKAAASEKITEATVRAKIAIEPEIQKLRKAQNLAREQELLYSNAIRAMEQRGKMLISLGAWMRAELGNMDMSISNNSPSKPRINPRDRREMFQKSLDNLD